MWTETSYKNVAMIKKISETYIVKQTCIINEHSKSKLPFIINCKHKLQASAFKTDTAPQHHEGLYKQVP